jgi:hypothetical protein
MLDLMTVWPDVSCDTTMKVGKLTLFAEIVLDWLCNYRFNILTKAKFLPS